tara:strand:+ start:106 stop:549 length:444 start_codon:yes stop_codon:yes gene_type:complete
MEFSHGQPKLGATAKQPSIAPRTFDWPPIRTQILPRPPIDDMSKSVEVSGFLDEQSAVCQIAGLTALLIHGLFHFLVVLVVINSIHGCAIVLNSRWWCNYLGLTTTIATGERERAQAKAHQEVCRNFHLWKPLSDSHWKNDGLCGHR